PVQRALVEHHGSQCGFCTPGFVMALAGMFETQTDGDRNALQQALTGNLCRCTGYLPILEAGLSLPPENVTRLTKQYHSSEMLEDLRRHLASPVYIHVSTVAAGSDLKRRTFYSPRSLEDALDFKALHSEATIVSGATELGVLGNKKGLHPAALLSLTNIPYLDQVSCEEDVVVIGANTTWTQIEVLAKEILPEFYKIIVRFGSPQIRNVATLAANVAHGSPIADSLPFLMITDAELELVSRRGVRRAKINGFYKG